MEDISKVRQPLPNFEAIYILTPEETVGSQDYPSENPLYAQYSQKTATKTQCCHKALS